MVNIKVKAELEILEEIIFLYITINKIQNSKKFGKYNKYIRLSKVKNKMTPTILNINRKIEIVLK